MNCVTKMRRKLLSEAQQQSETAHAQRSCPDAPVHTHTHTLSTIPSPMEHYGDDIARVCSVDRMLLFAILRQKSPDWVSFFLYFVRLFGEASCGILFIKCLWWKLPSLVFVVLRFSCACCIAKNNATKKTILKTKIHKRRVRITRIRTPSTRKFPSAI